MPEKYFSKSILLFLLLAVIWLFINATVNRHNHYLSEGYYISHAHPYDKIPTSTDPYGSHNHSETQLFLLSLICDPVTTASVLFMLWLFLIAVFRLFKINTSPPLMISRFYQVLNYHAPPG